MYLSGQWQVPIGQATGIIPVSQGGRRPGRPWYRDPRLKYVLKMYQNKLI